jgi:hypothetical protein
LLIKPGFSVSADQPLQGELGAIAAPLYPG